MMALSVHVIPGVKTNGKRAVVFLADVDDERLDAKSEYDSLPEKIRNDVNSRFEHWIDGNVHDDYFHGWNDPERSFCFVFKYRKKGNRCRLYGFLCKPRVPNDPRFTVCVLAIYAQKNTHETDPSIIASLDEFRSNEVAKRAILTAFLLALESTEKVNGKPEGGSDKRSSKLDRAKR